MRTHISEYLLFLLISLSLIQVINWSRRDLSENPDNLSQAVTMDRWIVPGRVVIGIFGLWKGFEYVLGRTVGCLHLKRVRSENVRNQWQFSPPSMGNGVVCWIKTKIDGGENCPWFLHFLVLLDFFTLSQTLYTSTAHSTRTTNIRYTHTWGSTQLICLIISLVVTIT